MAPLTFPSRFDYNCVGVFATKTIVSWQVSLQVSLWHKKVAIIRLNILSLNNIQGVQGQNKKLTNAATMNLHRNKHNTALQTRLNFITELSLNQCLVQNCKIWMTSDSIIWLIEISRTISYSSNYNQNMIRESQHLNLSNSLISHFNVLTSTYTSNYCCKGSYFLWYIIYHVAQNRFAYSISNLQNKFNRCFPQNMGYKYPKYHL